LLGPEGYAIVTIDPTPDAVTVNGGGTFCGSDVLTATGGAGGTIYYQINTPNGTNTTFQTSTATVSSTGTYYFRSRSDMDAGDHREVQQ